ncbi:MAG: hypothetical protein OXU74_04235 [Gemmatimonadota bacterium]|nr:hypothetical protein [Gemmatimonadota bacterium]
MPDPVNLVMFDLVGSAAGAFLGVIAGTLITILAARLWERRAYRQQVHNLVFELRLNIKKIDRWLSEITKYRNAVNGDSLHTWFGYFDLGKASYPTANDMFRTGLLYKALSHEHIEALQSTVAELSPVGEKYMNERFMDSRRAFEDAQQRRNLPYWLNVAKPEAVRIADFWEHKMQGHRSILDEIVRAIDDRSIQRRAQ